MPDCIIPIIALIFTIYYLTTITDVPWISQASAMVVSGLLLLSILAFVLRSFWRIQRGEETIRLQGVLQLLTGDRDIRLKRLALLILAIGYVGFIENLGFTLSTLVFVFAGIVVLSSWSNWKKALIISLSCSFLGYVIFIYLFKTRFPSGLIENLLKGLL